MHILAGMVISMLLSGKTKKTHLGRSPKDFVVTHASKGRMRLYSTKLKNSRISEVLAAELQKVAGVNKIESNPVTGSALILYDASQIKADLLAGAVYQLLGLEPLEQSQNSASVFREIHEINRSFSQALMEKTNGAIDSRTLVAGTFLALGIKELVNKKSLGMPAPITLFYWAYNSFGINKNS